MQEDVQTEQRSLQSLPFGTPWGYCGESANAEAIHASGKDVGAIPFLTLLLLKMADVGNGSSSRTHMLQTIPDFGYSPLSRNTSSMRRSTGHHSRSVLLINVPVSVHQMNQSALDFQHNEVETIPRSG